jgi:succinyl-CoA synthetase beta subunit
VETHGGQYIAADARLVVDDNAVYRHPSFQARFEQGKSTLSPLEVEAQDAGMAYVELEGNIGIIGNGAGLVMATMDTIGLFGGKPANFLDVGGGASADRMEIALNIILKNPHVKLVFVNIMGGITRCDDMARGILQGIKNHPELKLVVRLVGTREKEGKKILMDNGIPVLDSMDAAAEQAVRLLR